MQLRTGVTKRDDTLNNLSLCDNDCFSRQTEAVLETSGT
jgi:hypothetical protein